MPSRPALAAATAATAGVIAAAGWVHLRFAPEHLMESTALGLGFYAMGIVQVAVALALVARRTSALVAGGAVAVNLAIAAVWLVSRTTGLPVGPEQWHAEAAAVPDVVCTVAEVWSALAVLYLLPRLRTHPEVAPSPA